MVVVRDTHAHTRTKTFFFIVVVADDDGVGAYGGDYTHGARVMLTGDMQK